MSGMKTDLPWASVTAEVLEEVIYALVRHMGATKYEWRSSDSINSSDGGRDVDATFERVGSSGEIVRERWWIDAKRRAATVSPTDVKEVALNAAGRDDVDVMIVATNSFFSNPTRDWITRHNARKIGPRVELWDRRRLQELIERYPAAAAETLVAALDFPQRIKFLTAYFFNSGRVLNESELSDAWSRIDEITDPSFLVAAAYADAINDRYRVRPWGAHLTPMTAVGVLTVSHSTLLVTLVRKKLSDELAFKAAAYLTAAALPILGDDLAAHLLMNPFSLLKDARSSPPPEHFTYPVLRMVFSQLLDVCSDDCARINVDPPRTIDHFELGSFWDRFNPSRPVRDKRSLISELFDVPCAVGFDVQKSGCPLHEPDVTDMKAAVGTLRRVIEFRLANPSGQWDKYKSVLFDLLGTEVVDAGFDELRRVMRAPESSSTEGPGEA